METREILKVLEQSDEFRKWRKQDSKSYLCHFFFMFGNDPLSKDSPVQVGYYHPEHDRIITFLVDHAEKQVKMTEESEIFKKPDAKVQELKMGSVKLDIGDAMESGIRIQKSEYKNEEPMKTIIVLQKLDKNIVWNVTYITKTMNTLNLKIDAANGKVVDKRLVSLMDFKVKDK